MVDAVRRSTTQGCHQRLRHCIDAVCLGKCEELGAEILALEQAGDSRLWQLDHALGVAKQAHCLQALHVRFCVLKVAVNSKVVKRGGGQGVVE